jgi:hypothetical protein
MTSRLGMGMSQSFFYSVGRIVQHPLLLIAGEPDVGPSLPALRLLRQLPRVLRSSAIPSPGSNPSASQKIEAACFTRPRVKLE